MVNKPTPYQPPKDLIFPSKGCLELDRERYVKERLLHYGVLRGIVRNADLEARLGRLDEFFNTVDELTETFKKS